jgi:hypothetical protein
MKRFPPWSIVPLAAAAPAAFGDGQSKSTAQISKNELAALGAANFRSVYAPPAHARERGQVRVTARRAAVAKHTNAAKACKAEPAADRAAFTAKYGVKAASAYGMCLSAKGKRRSGAQHG